jgi:hypothetical protein
MQPSPGLPVVTASHKPFAISALSSTSSVYSVMPLMTQ